MSWKIKITDKATGKERLSFSRFFFIDDVEGHIKLLNKLADTECTETSNRHAHLKRYTYEPIEIDKRQHRATKRRKPTRDSTKYKYGKL